MRAGETRLGSNPRHPPGDVAQRTERVNTGSYSFARQTTEDRPASRMAIGYHLTLNQALMRSGRRSFARGLSSLTRGGASP